MQKNIMIVGVGGQGTLLASRILGNLLTSRGYDVKVSEVHGMSQRGGSVVTYVKYGDKIYSPIIDKGEADIILAFERLEALRALPYLKVGGTMIVNDRAVDPMPVITGAAKYPEGILEELAKDYKGKVEVYKVDVDKCKDLARAFNISSIPALLFIPVDGEPQMLVGLRSKESLKKDIDTILLKK